jgi:hypothetical protein
MDEHRILRPSNIADMALKLDNSKIKFLLKVENALEATKKFSTAVSSAIGDISIGEAHQGIIDYFVEQMNK